jgi:hypothetical protein
LWTPDSEQFFSKPGALPGKCFKRNIESQCRGRVVKRGAE